MSQRVRWNFLCGPGFVQETTLVDAFEQSLLQLMWLEQKRMAQALANDSLTVPQFLVLASIWQRQEACPMGELADSMLQSSATMTGIVDRLVRMELVHRRTVANDRRVVVIDLTERGRELLLHVHQERRQQLQLVLNRLPESDRVLLLRLLREYLNISSQ